MNKTDQINPHPSRRSRSAILRECSPVVQDVRTIELLFCLVLFFRSLLRSW